MPLPSIFEHLQFHEVTGDLKRRLKRFVDDLRKYHYAMLTAFPFMTELCSQSGQLSFAQSDVDHIFKYESLRSEYENILNDPADRFCVDESDHFAFREDIEDREWDELLLNLGVNREDLMDKAFREYMGLPVSVGDGTFEDITDLERMDALYVYDAMDYDVYSKLVEYYWQDFVCFDYAADYKHDVLDVPL